MTRKCVTFSALRIIHDFHVFGYIKVTVLGSIHYDTFDSYEVHRALLYVQITMLRTMRTVMRKLRLGCMFRCSKTSVFFGGYLPKNFGNFLGISELSRVFFGYFWVFLGILGKFWVFFGYFQK